VKTPSKIAAAATTLALVLTPAAALANGGSGSHGKNQNAPGHTKAGSKTSSTSSNAKAYGRFCQGESKQHVAGQPGTPFSTCVKDMAQLAKSSKTNPHIVCANESKKHVAGQKRTPYSACVSAAAKLRRHHGSGTTSSS
jgi:hypothetical protein